MLTLIIGYLLDLIFGDPQGFPHPIRLIGKLIYRVEKYLRDKCKSNDDERKAGVVLWLTVVIISFLIPFIILLFVYKFSYILGIIVESVMIYFILAAKSLRVESMKVYTGLVNNNIIEARRYLSYIVGRDTENLDASSISRAAVETVAENTSDGVIAPMLFVILGGAPLGFMYKAINTLDSMVGYKNEKYINMGRFSAIADDVANYIPARISAYLMILASMILKMDYKSACKIYKRDRYNHNSPNSAHTEAVCAGSLNIMLGGDSFYGGVPVHKPTIGDNIREIETEDIRRANNLMYVTSAMCLILGSIILSL
ncbi:cobalamin biosynthesis protein CobD [Sedimentibacter hydroxybenzoicus DSM 7310]|uniref:Cobalamin biosynthesis protein CobD n=1 Tax=Sedimentibacter hydroxybenzoicus DSM 7310 TaxID=1123245 RepID=A0A974BMR5_SEDHY|nr:adenosylcobinamide-phosphate synthase CbiB [Sedimentibacter hydroxybenzoicus]NYB75731.1 cobalamin biosynthesis protein CobD [Sedimentibacter hydroxybenzoicus DSM 7310]